MADSQQENTPVSLQQWLAVMGGALAAFMAVLDIQITNASLQNIQGALSASPEESTWISTAYLVAEVIIIPMTGWLCRVFSLRRYMLASVVLFIIFSILCGLSWSLSSMITFRALQGLFGGALIPLAFTLIMTLLPEKDRPKGMALFSLSAVCSPAFGPALGGWLTDSWSWHMIFFINIVPGAVMYILLTRGLPKGKANLAALKQGDWFGIVTMAVGLACLQIVLEEGNRKDWFGSDEIVFLSLISATALVAFIIREMTCKQPLINLRLMARPRFGLGSLANMGIGFCLYSAVYLLPLYLGMVHGYTPTQIGLVIMWMGVPQLFIVPMVPKLIERFGTVNLAMVGILLFSSGFWLSGHLNPDFAGPQFHLVQLLRAIGLPLIMTPLMITTTQGMPRHEAADASSLFNILRNLGGAIGMAVMATLLTNRTLLHDTRIREALPQTVEKLYHAYPAASYMEPQSTLAMFSMEINRQASIMAYADDFILLTWIMLGCMGLVWLAGRYGKKETVANS
ncbi:DHA2 family efflux MFS transporter permease subunit [Endozoicomonas sp. Mp262]|uniref:DHA2 family efflux MFS transporter permease subunit n=1 Tax=Endozoicomonas sp. Mp262 TaxID=2919499 RepID=UPI0021D9ACDF